MKLPPLNCIIFMFCCLLIVSQFCLAGEQAATKLVKEDTGRILFSSYSDDSWQIWSIDPDGRNLVRISDEQNDLHFPAASADGTIACSSNAGDILHLLPNEKGHKYEGLPPNCNHPDYSPGGDMLALACFSFGDKGEDSDIWFYDLAKDRAKRLRQNDIQIFPAWSPDGTQIVYTSGHRVSSTKVVEALWVVNVDSLSPKPLVNDGYYAMQPSWSPDGKWIAYASSKNGNMDIWVVDRQGKNARSLTLDPSYDADPSWSPDGSSICFSSTRSGQMEIWVMDSDGENVRQLTGKSGLTGESMHSYWQKGKMEK